MKKTKYRRLRNPVIVLCLVVLSFVVFVNPMPVKSIERVYEVDVKTDKLYVDDDTYDGSGNGEFVFQCKFDFWPTVYSSGQVSLGDYETWYGRNTLKLDYQAAETSKIWFKLKEVDPWPNPDDTVVDWQYRYVWQFGEGGDTVTFYDDDETGLYCRFYLYIVEIT